VTGEPQQQQEVPYPLAFKGELEEPLSQLLWSVKVFLLVPHFVVLLFLFLGFALAWVISLFAILFTGRYPRRLFDFNLGVLRWTWRVWFYGLGAGATDRYPPFTLKAVDYPADLDVPYPQKLSRGLVLIKWWLLALPQYMVVCILGYLIFMITGFAQLAVFLTERYPRDLFDFVLDMHRWAYRVAVYAALMTDRYPPFRLGE
jgi:hypothetical protein